MDWDHIMRNKARSGSFAGRGATDEDAYYVAFAGDEKHASLSRMYATARRAGVAVAAVGAFVLSTIQIR